MLLTEAVALAPSSAHDPETVSRRFLLFSALNKSDRDYHRRQARELLVEFVKAAAADGHRKLGAAYVHLGLFEVGDFGTASTPALGREHMVRARAHYEAAVAAKAALPAFLQSGEIGSATERQLRMLVYPMGQPIEAILDSPGVAPALTAPRPRYGGQALLADNQAWPGPGPANGVTAQLQWQRELVNEIVVHGPPTEATLQTILLASTEAAASLTHCSVWSGTAVDDGRLVAIDLTALRAPQRDQVFSGRALTLLVASVAVRLGSALFVIVEDARRDCVRLTLYNTSVAEDKLWTPGRVVRVRNPYARMMPHLHKTLQVVRVDNPLSTLTIDPVVRPSLCWHCLLLAPAAALQRCGRCDKATYCSVECQTKDWRENKHKTACALLKG